MKIVTEKALYNWLEENNSRRDLGSLAAGGAPFCSRIVRAFRERPVCCGVILKIADFILSMKKEGKKRVVNSVPRPRLGTLMGSQSIACVIIRHAKRGIPT
jgi:hypothetical protein